MYDETDCFSCPVFEICKSNLYRIIFFKKYRAAGDTTRCSVMKGVFEYLSNISEDSEEN